MTSVQMLQKMHKQATSTKPKTMTGCQSSATLKVFELSERRNKSAWTRNMSITTNVNLYPEIISKESSKESKDSDNSKEQPKGAVCVVRDSILNGVDEKLLLRKRVAKVWLFSGAMINDMHDLLKSILKQNTYYIMYIYRYK